MPKPLAIEMYSGLSGWGEGLIAEGYRVVAFDLVDMFRQTGTQRPEGIELVLQDVLTIHGKQFRDAAIICSSSPCQEFSYRSLPFKRCKSLGPPLLGIKLFEAQFRIQREASEAAGHHIPMVVENVRGAQPWVGRAKWHYGSYYLFGDVPALMPFTKARAKAGGLGWSEYAKTGVKSKGFNTTYDQQQRALRQDDATKLPGNGSARHFKDREIPRLNGERKHEDGSYTVAVGGRLDGMARPTSPVQDGVKVPSLDGGRRTDIGKGARMVSRDCGDEGIKQHGSGAEWFDTGIARHGSNTSARKAATAQISKIPLALASYIAQVYYPR